MSGEEPGYVPPDHKTTAEFRAPRGAAEPEAAAPGPEATFVDEPADDLFDSGATLQDFPECDPETGPPTPEGSMADATFVDVLFDDPPYQDDDPEDDRDDEAPVTVAEPLDTITDTPSSATGASAGGAHASVTATDVPVPFKRSEPPEAIVFEMPAPVYGQAAPVPEQATAPGDAPAAMQEQAPPVQEQPTADQQAPAPGTASDPATAPPPEEQATADQHAAAPVPPAPAPAEAPWTEQFAAEGESADPANPAFAYAMPGPPPQGSAPPQEGTAPAMPPAASPSGGVLPGPSGPTGPSGSGRRPILFVALAAGVVVLLAAAGVTVLLLTSGSDKEEPTTTSPSPAASAPAAQGGGPAPTTSGGAAPSGAPAAPPAGGQPASPPVPTAPIGPVKQGDGITYQLVQQDEGYFEGRMTITNRTGKPMKTWKLTFGTPGAKVKNIWGAELVKGGEKAEIKNLDDAPPIPPGGTWAVQFGAEGAATTPKGCKLNGEACGF